VETVYYGIFFVCYVNGIGNSHSDISILSIYLLSKVELTDYNF